MRVGNPWLDLYEHFALFQFWRPKGTEWKSVLVRRQYDRDSSEHVPDELCSTSEIYDMPFLVYFRFVMCATENCIPHLCASQEDKP